jgi:hypothetical protein
MNRSTITKALLAAALAAIAALAVPALAAAKDRNHDRIPDRWEKRHHLSLHVKQTRRDQDRDHLRNRAEFMAGDNPRDRDSDDDGVMDGEENAGTIASFDSETGRLTINLFNGDSISGLVTDQTEIECEGDEATASHEDSSGPGSGDEEPAEEEPGDDHGEEADDDHGEENEHEDDNSGPGSDDSGENDDQQDHACSADHLVEGAVVEEAELKLENGQAIFEEVELA